MKSKSKFKYLAIIWWLFMFCGLAVFLWGHIDCLLDSDMSSELVLAELLADENALISKNWFYSTEIRVLNTQIFYAPLFKISSDWHFVRVAGTVLMLALMSLGLYYMFCKMRCRSAFPMAAAFLVLPISDGYFDRVLKGAYYIPHILISFLLMGMVFQFTKALKKRQKICLLLCIGIVSFISGMGGPRQLMVFQMPLVLTVILLAALEYKRGKTKNILNLYLCPAMAAFITAAAGYFINTRILSQYYHFKIWEDIRFTDFDFSAIMSVINGFLLSYGYTSGSVLSFNLFQNLFSIALLFSTVYCIVLTLKQKYEEKDKELLLMSGFYLSATIVYMGLYAFTSLVYDYRYNLPIIVFSIPIIALGIKRYIPDKKIKYIVCTLVIVCATVCSCVKYNKYSEQDNTEEYRQIAEYLVENEYLNGYGTFWNGNVLTELSDGRIEVWTWNVGEMLGNLKDINWIYDWLQPVEHAGKIPDGKVFVLLDSEEMERFCFKEFLDKINPIYSTDNYMIFGFEDYEELTMALTNYSSDFSSGQWTIQGGDNSCEILPGEYLHGPGITLYPGDYEISIEGINLDKASVYCVYDSGDETIDIYDLKNDGANATYGICLDDTVLSAEIGVKNDSELPIILKKVTIQKKSGEKGAA